MKDKEIKERLKATPDVGEVKHIDYQDYCTPMARRQKQPNGSYILTENLYMGVDGRVAMALADHAGHEDATLEQLPTQILENNEERITLQVGFKSSIYGTRYGIASSRLNAGAAEGSHPWEVAETSATGRCFGLYGYGNIPGAGRASAEDMQRVTNSQGRPKQARPKVKSKTPRAVLGKYPHWFAHPQVKARFDQLLEALAITEKEATQALEVNKIADFDGTMKEAKAKLEEWIEEQMAGEPEPPPENAQEGVQEIDIDEIPF